MPDAALGHTQPPSFCQPLYAPRVRSNNLETLRTVIYIELGGIKRKLTVKIKKLAFLFLSHPPSLLLFLSLRSYKTKHYTVIDIWWGSPPFLINNIFVAWKTSDKQWTLKKQKKVVQDHDSITQDSKNSNCN